MGGRSERDQFRFDMGMAPEQDQSYTDDWLRQILGAYRDTNFVQRLFEPGLWGQIDNKNGSYSSHLMSSGGDRQPLAYPEIVWDPSSQSLVKLSPSEAGAYAETTPGAAIPFASDGAADYFATNYKRAFPAGWFAPWRTK